jgi:hypothetical protein
MLKIYNTTWSQISKCNTIHTIVGKREINYSTLCGSFSMTYISTGCWSLWKDVNFCMNKLNVPSVSCEMSNIVIIPARDDEPLLRQPSLLSHCLLNTEQLSHGIFHSSVYEHATHISERVTTIVRPVISSYE